MAIDGFFFRVVIKPDPVLEKKGSIILATNKALERGATQSGTVVSIGEDAFAAYRPKREFAGLKIGDHVAYAKYAGKWVQDPDFPDDAEKEMLVVNDEDITCILRKTTNDLGA